MTLSELVPTLEVCQQLKAAGFPQDTAMVWVGLWGVDAHWHVQTRESIEIMRAQPELDRIENGATPEERGLVTLSAPTVAELEQFAGSRVDVNDVAKMLMAIAEGEAREFGLRVEPQDFPMQLLPKETT